MYAPGPVPPTNLGAYVRQELEKVKAALAPQSMLQLEVSHVEPAKPRDGMIVLADGISFDPGSGAGLYYYLSGTWNFVG